MWVTEHNVITPSGDGEAGGLSETCTVITTLLDDEAAPADQFRDTYLTRRSASETTFGEDKTTIAGAGNRTSGPVLRSGPRGWSSRKHGPGWTATQLVRASEAAALRSGHAAARALRRKDGTPVTADEESFTAARNHMIQSMTTSQVTATSIAGRDRRRGRLRRPRRAAHPERPRTAAALQTRAESRPKFPHATATKTTVTGKPQVTVFAPGSC